MYKNALIISDNNYICKKFFEIIQRKKQLDCSFTFSISPFSKVEDFIISDNTNIIVINLKIQEDVDFVKQNFDLVFSIHCKQIFPNDLINAVKCINIHPGYNPINRGWYPQVFSIIYDLPIGATIHEIDEKLDHGGIIARAFVEKEIFDTSETLYNRIIAKELELLDEFMEFIINKDYRVIDQEEEQNLFLKKDFNDLLELNLEEQVSVRDLINRLRALTHGNFNNAFFIDKKTGRKVYVAISLKLE